MFYFNKKFCIFKNDFDKKKSIFIKNFIIMKKKINVRKEKCI